MPNLTPNYNFKKPVYPESADISIVNENFDVIDEALTPAVSQDTAPTSASTKGKLAAVLGWFANRIKAITGKANWWDTPSITLEQAATHISSGTHAIATILVAGFMSAADKLKLTNATSGATASQLMARDANGRAQVASPSASYDIVNKTYVDDNYLKKNTDIALNVSLTAQSNINYTVRQVRNIVFWNSGVAPTTQNGDVLIKTF